MNLPPDCQPQGATRDFRAIAAMERRTLSSLTEELLRLGLAARRRRSPRKLSPLPTWNMGKPKVDLADRNALYDAMEAR